MGADLDDHAAARAVRRRTDLGDDEIALVLAFAVLVQLGVLDDEFADGSGEAADVEVAVPAVDGLDGQLAGKRNHGSAPYDDEKPRDADYGRSTARWREGKRGPGEGLVSQDDSASAAVSAVSVSE